MVFLLLLPMVSHAEVISISGFTEPVHDSNLGLSVTGRVARILVKEGQSVKKGQPLLELEQRLEQLEVQQRNLLWLNRAEIDAATRQLETLTRHLEDTRTLFQTTGSVTREEMDNQELEHDLARIDLKRLEVAKEREEIEYAIAQAELYKRTLLAPFTGEIVEILIGIGENCEPDTPLVHLVATSPLNFVANVELGVSQRLSLGQSVQLQFETGAESASLKARIEFISPVVDPASGLRKIKARFDNPDHDIVPGITGVMRVDAQ